ncbi:MAG: RidA family protein [Actinomycetota bacterium]|jgi:2-iminobutanoate/2-iminopropanoate deaminase|nr:RidA family protein [Actinomycetota bacterium]MDA3014015.1 RidA family protein [Actinomycetota bacterium]MDA3027353.1 RidA family protein [Actinomycetota bacterium]
MTVVNPISPPTMAPPPAAYAHGVSIEGATRWVHTSGVVPVSADGSVPADLSDQAALVWRNVLAILAAADMSASDIVSVTTYVVVGEDLSVVMAARDVALGGHLAASTLVTVPALARAEWRMEIAVIAAA